MNVFECTLTSLVVGIFLSICAFFVHHPVIKPRESEIGAFRILIVYLVRMAHYFVLAFIFTYLLFSEINLFYDTFVAGIIALIYLHWQMLGSCCLSIVERSMLNISHDMFDNPVYLEIFQIHPKITDWVNNKIWIPFAALALRILYQFCDKSD